MKYIIVFCCLFFIGCVGYIESNEIETLEEACREYGGIKHISVGAFNPSSPPKATCNNEIEIVLQQGG